MRKTKEYPINLMMEVNGWKDLPEDFLLTSDMSDGVEKAISFLNEEHKTVIKALYFERCTRADFAKRQDIKMSVVDALKAKALRELRHPETSDYIKYGLMGVERAKDSYKNRIKEKEEQDRKRALEKEYHKVHAPYLLTFEDLFLDKEIDRQLYSCMTRNHLVTLQDVSEYEEIQSIRNFGKVGRWKLHLLLEKYGMAHVWKAEEVTIAEKKEMEKVEAPDEIKRCAEEYLRLCRDMKNAKAKIKEWQLESGATRKNCEWYRQFVERC